MYYQEKMSLAAEIVQETGQGVMVTDPNGVIQSVNNAFTKVTGFKEEEAVGQTPSILKSGKQDAEFYKTMWAALRDQGSWQGELWNRRKNGEIYLEWLTINSIRNEAGEIKYYAAMFSDMTNARQYNQGNERKED